MAGGKRKLFEGPFGGFSSDEVDEATEFLDAVKASPPPFREDNPTEIQPDTDPATPESSTLDASTVMEHREPMDSLLVLDPSPRPTVIPDSEEVTNPSPAGIDDTVMPGDRLKPTRPSAPPQPKLPSQPVTAPKSSLFGWLGWLVALVAIAFASWQYFTAHRPGPARVKATLYADPGRGGWAEVPLEGSGLSLGDRVRVVFPDRAAREASVSSLVLRDELPVAVIPCGRIDAEWINGVAWVERQK